MSAEIVHSLLLYAYLLIYAYLFTFLIHAACTVKVVGILIHSIHAIVIVHSAGHRHSGPLVYSGSSQTGSIIK